MVEFYNTQMGRKFYDSTMPRIAKALESIARSLETTEEPGAPIAKEQQVAVLETSKWEKGRKVRLFEDKQKAVEWIRSDAYREIGEIAAEVGYIPSFFAMDGGETEFLVVYAEGVEAEDMREERAKELDFVRYEICEIKYN